MSMRTFLERMSRRRSFVRHLPANLGGLPIIVSPDAQLKYLKPGPKGFDRTLLEAAVRLVRPGDNVWDVGANVGVFSVAAAALSLTGQIVAIEADIWLASLLSRTARLPANAAYNISVLPVAAFSTAGVASFAIAARGRASSHLAGISGNSQAGGVRETVEVPTLPLDSLLARYAPPRIIKIDVEGAEVDVLRGMDRILREIRPVLYCEVNGQNRENFLSEISRFDYAFRNLDSTDEDAGFNAVYFPREKKI